ncbi:histidine phosphatase family protein [Naumannella huperziae]
MTDIYLVRHGQTEWSADGRHTSTTDLPLTADGEREAAELRGRLDPADFGLVLSSPRARARRTAQIAGFDPDRLVIDDDLAEWAYGDYEGVTSAKIRESVPGWTIWSHPTPGGETAEQVRVRCERVISRVEASGVERAVLFGHGHALRALTLTWLGLDFALGDRFPLETGTLSVLGPYKDGRALLSWNSR